MKKNIIYSLLLVVAVLFAGCEDRLDIAKHGNMGGQDDFYKTNEQTEQAVAAMYGRVKGLYLLGSSPRICFRMMPGVAVVVAATTTHSSS